MTVYVDSYRVQATVGRFRARWSHLTADTPDELHAFAAQLGLRRSWYQEQCRSPSCRPCPHWHYDVVDAKRAQAIRAGAQPITFRDLAALISARRRAAREGDGRDGTTT